MTIRIGINGFGRIGRVVFRAAMQHKDLEIVHINDLTDTKTLAHLLKYDSVHGTLAADVVGQNDGLQVAGREVSVSAIKDPAELPWASKKVDVVFECTGIFTQRDAADLHLKAGAPKVIISAPAKGEDLTVVYGVNHELLKPEYKVISNGSCTTNCLAPVVKVLNEEYGVVTGQMTTVHSYTNDQRTLDLPHKDLRRARAAALNMIPTSTGAAKAIGLVIPELAGKIQGLAVRVPTPNVSLVDFTCEIKKSATAEEINASLQKAAEGPLKGVLSFTSEPLVSSDFNGNPYSSIVDGQSTLSTGTLVKVLSWYDNETGFSNRMLDVARLFVR